MSSEALRAQAPRLIVALALIAFGILLVAEEAGLAGAAAIHRWYFPMVLAGLGLSLILRTGIARIVGVGLLILAAIATLDRLDGAGNLDFGDLVGPLIMIFWGGVMLRWGLGPRGTQNGTQEAGATVNNLAIMAGHELRSTSKAFRGGSLSAVMGACELDLTQAKAVPEGSVLEVFALWGGVEIRVPRNWNVVSEVMPLMGAFEDKREPDPEGGSGGSLTIRGLAIMGGIEIST